ncbi:MAG: anaerobic selenocysteine-containing dehydrogenase [Candidatus Aldehydirespiratoraceae bacterium]|jgi:anaerobic selenocysteine-containing dehydrogenase
MSAPESTKATSLDTRKTFCRVCHAACPVLVDVEITGASERVVGVRGDRDDPVFGGYTCIKGRQLPDQHHDPTRLRSTMQRTAAGFNPVGTGEALDDIASRIAAIVAKYGPRAVASYTGTGAFQNSTSVPVAAAWHAGFDSPSFYTSITIDQPAHRSAALRLGAWEAGWDNFTESDVTLVVGYNPLVSSYGPSGGLQGTNPFVKVREAKERGLSLIVIDPRQTETAKFADVWLQVQPGEDPALLAGMIRHILDNDLHDLGFCAHHVDQLDDLRAAVDPFTIDEAVRRARVAGDDIVRAAELFAAGPRGSAGTGTGPNMAPHSMLTEHLALTLNVLCGRVLQPGDTLESGAFLTPGDTRRAQVIPPSNPAPGTPHRVRNLNGMPGEMLTNALADEILMEGEGQVRALIVSGGNPIVAWPDQKKTEAALASLDLLVVIDPRMTPTAELADYVIAPRLELERADVPHIMDRRIPSIYTNYTPAVLATKDDLLAEWEVFAGIAARNETPINLPGGPLTADEDDDSVLDLVYATSRIGMDEIRAHRGAVHDDNPVRVVAGDPEATGRFAVAPSDVVAELTDVHAEGRADAYAEFPFRLTSRRMKHVLNSLGRELPGLASVGTTNPAYMNPADLESLGLAEGDLATIESPHGRITGVVAAAPDVKLGVVSMSHSWGLATRDDADVREHGVATNALVANDVGYDPITGMAVQSAIPVRLSPAR